MGAGSTAPMHFWSRRGRVSHGSAVKLRMINDRHVLKLRMINDRHVLIVSTVADMATDDVVKRLSSHGIPHQRLNTEDYPFSHSLAFLPGGQESSLFSDEHPIRTPSSVWYRRVRSPSKPTGMDAGIYDY